MDPILQAGLKAQLQRSRQNISAALDSLVTSAKPIELDQTVQGRLSRMDAICQQHMAQASTAHLRQECARIAAAMSRMDGGRYGICCRCAEAMDVERLKADPSAPFCLGCLDELAEELSERERRA